MLAALGPEARADEIVSAKRRLETMRDGAVAVALARMMHGMFGRAGQAVQSVGASLQDARQEAQAELAVRRPIATEAARDERENRLADREAALIRREAELQEKLRKAQQAPPSAPPAWPVGGAAGIGATTMPPGFMPVAPGITKVRIVSWAERVKLTYWMLRIGLAGFLLWNAQSVIELVSWYVARGMRDVIKGSIGGVFGG